MSFFYVKRFFFGKSLSVFPGFDRTYYRNEHQGTGNQDGNNQRAVYACGGGEHQGTDAGPQECKDDTLGTGKRFFHRFHGG